MKDDKRKIKNEDDLTNKPIDTQNLNTDNKENLNRENKQNINNGNQNIVNESDQLQNKPKDNRSVGEKIDDAVDDFFGTVEDVVYGEKQSILTDIPATMVNGSGVRKVLKIQTRKNLNKKIFCNKTALKVILWVIGGMIALSVLVGIIGLFF